MSDGPAQQVKSFCAKCKTKQSITTHHILPKRFNRGSTNITPFINLCRKCHDIIERRLEKWELKNRYNRRFRARKPLKPHEYFKVLEQIIGFDYLRYVYCISCWNFKAYLRLDKKRLPKPIWQCQNPSCRRQYDSHEHDGACFRCNRYSLKPVWSTPYADAYVGNEIIIKSYTFSTAG
jgi:hypothetical protein